MRCYRGLDAKLVVETIATLGQRIAERFPGAGLVEVCGELLAIAQAKSLADQPSLLCLP